MKKTLISLLLFPSLAVAQVKTLTTDGATPGNLKQSYTVPNGVTVKAAGTGVLEATAAQPGSALADAIAAGSGSAWGGITGTLSSQTDLASALAGKVDLTSASALNLSRTSTYIQLSAPFVQMTGSLVLDGTNVLHTISWVDGDGVPVFQLGYDHSTGTGGLTFGTGGTWITGNLDNTTIVNQLVVPSVLTPDIQSGDDDLTIHSDSDITMIGGDGADVSITTGNGFSVLGVNGSNLSMTGTGYTDLIGAAGALYLNDTSGATLVDIFGAGIGVTSGQIDITDSFGTDFNLPGDGSAGLFASGAIQLQSATGVGVGTADPGSQLQVTSGAGGDNDKGGASDPPGTALTVIGPDASTPQGATVSIQSNTARAQDVGPSIGLGGRYFEGNNVYAQLASIKAGFAEAGDGLYGGYLDLGTRSSGGSTIMRLRLQQDHAAFSTPVWVPNNLALLQDSAYIAFLASSSARLGYLQGNVSGTGIALVSESATPMTFSSAGTLSAVSLGDITIASDTAVSITDGSGGLITLDGGTTATIQGSTYLILSTSAGGDITVDGDLGFFSAPDYQAEFNSVRTDSYVVLHGYTVATLPPSPPPGSTAFVTDADAPIPLEEVTGGGSKTVPVFFTGDLWIVH